MGEVGALGAIAGKNCTILDVDAKVFEVNLDVLGKRIPKIPRKKI